MTDSQPTPPPDPAPPDRGNPMGLAGQAQRAWPAQPAGPAWGRLDPRIEDLVEYLAANGDTFTREALVGQAEAAGYPGEVIEAALARLPEHLDMPRVERLKEASRRIVWIAYSLGFLALVVGTASQTYIGGLQGPIIGGQLILIVIAAALSLTAVRTRRSAPRNTGAALVSMLAFPLLVFVVFPGLCIYGFITSRVGQ